METLLYLLIKLFVPLFFAILFLQSGLDKVFNWRGNYDWVKGHFSKSPLAGSVGIMMPLLTLTEVAAGIVSLVGAVMLLVDEQSNDFALWGVVLSMVALLMLFFGQRIAQDYEGAKTIAIYFGVALVGAVIVGL